MRICLVGPSYPLRGGIAHYTTLLCNELKRRGHETKLISFSRLYPGFLFPGKTQQDTSSVPIKADAEPIIDSLNPITWFAANKAIRRFQPDMVIASWWHPMFGLQYGTAARSLKQSQLVYICHNVEPHESNRWLRGLTEYALGKGDHFIVHSEEDHQNLLRLIPDAHVVKSYHPTYEVFNDGDWDRETCRRELGVEGNVILFFGLVRRYKGLIHLVRAMPKVLSEIDATLLIVGEFYEKKEGYIEEIDSLGISDRVKIIDQYVPNEEVGRYFAASDVVALPYISATQSGIIQIAFGFDKPVIATTVGGLPEVVKHGETGFLVLPENPDVLAETITTYFRENLAGQFSRNIAETKKEFAWERLVDLIEGLAGKEQTPCAR